MIKPEEALDLLAVARDSKFAYERPWLDTKFQDLHTLTLSAYAAKWDSDPFGALPLYQSKETQDFLLEIKEEDGYRTLCKHQRITVMGRYSRHWFRTKREARFGKTPNEV